LEDSRLVNGLLIISAVNLPNE